MDQSFATDRAASYANPAQPRKASGTFVALMYSLASGLKATGSVSSVGVTMLLENRALALPRRWSR